MKIFRFIRHKCYFVYSLADIFANFWNAYPAFLYGLSTLLAVKIALSFQPIDLALLTLFFLPLISGQNLYRIFLLKHLANASLIALTVFTFTHYFHKPPEEPSSSGTIYFTPTTIKQKSTFGRSKLTYIGTASFHSDNHLSYYHLPARMTLHNKIPPNQTIRFQGHLERNVPSFYHLVPKDQNFSGVPDTHSYAQWRFVMKKKVATFLNKHVPRSASYFSALLTGELDNPLLSYDFSHCGLQHILAISGFHFAFLTLFISYFLRPLLSKKMLHIAMLCFISGYFFFLGPTPSILRAFITLFLYYIAKLFRLRATGLNLLGLCLMIELLLSPLNIYHIGFQLTFTSTAAILLLYPSFEKALRTLLPQYDRLQFDQFSIPDRYCLIITRFLRKALALNFAVHLFAIPILLYHFHTFPLLSLLYNLFFPILLPAQISLLFASLFFPFLRSMTDTLTAASLKLLSYPPPLFDIRLHISSFPLPVLLTLLALLLSLAICYRDQESKLIF